MSMPSSGGPPPAPLLTDDTRRPAATGSVHRHDTRRTVGIVIAATGSVIMGTLLIGILAVWWFVRGIVHHDLPTCSAPAVTVVWTAQPGSRLLSQTFAFEHDTRVQVDAIVHGDNSAAIFPSWGTIYVAPVGFDLSRLAAYDAAWDRSRPGGSPPVTAGTLPAENPYDELIEVGTGVNAINRQVMVPSGHWMLLATHPVGSAHMHSPC